MAIIHVRLTGEELRRAISYRNLLKKIVCHGQSDQWHALSYVDALDSALDGMLDERMFPTVGRLLDVIFAFLELQYENLRRDPIEIQIDKNLLGIAWTSMNGIEMENLRKQLGYRVGDFAKALGVGRSTYYHWKTGIHQIPPIGVTAMKLLALAKSHGLAHRWLDQVQATNGKQPYCRTRLKSPRPLDN